MIPYWVIFILPSFFLFFHFDFNNQIKTIAWYFFLLILVLFIGLRYEVGGDWYQYIVVYDYE